MVDTDKLRGVIAEKELSQRKVAETLGISDKTFYDKMKKGVFSSAEIDVMIGLLDMTEPMKIFFCKSCSAIRYNEIEEAQQSSLRP